MDKTQHNGDKRDSALLAEVTDSQDARMAPQRDEPLRKAQSSLDTPTTTDATTADAVGSKAAPAAATDSGAAAEDVAAANIDSGTAANDVAAANIASAAAADAAIDVDLSDAGAASDEGGMARSGDDNGKDAGNRAGGEIAKSAVAKAVAEAIENSNRAFAMPTEEGKIMICGVLFTEEELRCSKNKNLCKIDCAPDFNCELGLSVIKRMAEHESSLSPARVAIKRRHEEMTEAILEHCRLKDEKLAQLHNRTRNKQGVESELVHQDELVVATSFYGRASKASDAQNLHKDGDYYKPWLESYPQDVPEFVDTQQFESLVDLFDSAVSKWSHLIAYENMGSKMSYEELGEQASMFAAYLQQELGLSKGDKIAIMMPNLMQFPVAFFGALKAGLTVSNINPLYTPRELKHQLDNSDASTIVVVANYADTLAEIIHETSVQNVIITEVGDALSGFMGLKKRFINMVVRMRGMVPEVDKSRFALCISFDNALKLGKEKLKHFMPVQLSHDDIALLQYTGGTTGRAKGAMLSHGNLLANIAQAEGMYGPVLEKGGETILTVIPIYHIFALTVNIVLFIYLGGKNLLITDPRNVKAFAKELHRHPEITALTGVNTLFNLLISHEEFSDLKWEHLHLVIGGGAAVQSGVEQRFFEKTGLHILEGYGLTECSPLVAVCPYNVDQYTGSIGLIVPSTIARIIDPEGNEIRDTEHEGELEIKGPQVMHGYYKAEKHNDYIFDDGFVRTGDIAKWMPGGYIKLIDRLKDMILVSGFNVFPNEIEDVVSRFNRVLECAVIGIPSDNTGEAVKLFVVKADPSLNAAEVKQYCRAYLTPYKVPRIIQFVDTLPKSPLGKVLRRKLRDMEGANPLTAEQQLAAIKEGKSPNQDMTLATNVIKKAHKVLREREAASSTEPAATASANATAATPANADVATAASCNAPAEDPANAATAANQSVASGGATASGAQSRGATASGAHMRGALDHSDGYGAAPDLHAAQHKDEVLIDSHDAASSIAGFGTASEHHAKRHGKQHRADNAYDNNEKRERAVIKIAAATGLRHDLSIDTKNEAELDAAAKAAAHELAAEPVKKTEGAIALERLLSSHGDQGLGAAIDTPNIHEAKKHSARLKEQGFSRSHIDRSLASESSDDNSKR